MISIVSSFEIISEVVPGLKTFFWIAAFIADAAVKTLLPNGGHTFSINVEPNEINGF